MKTVLLCLLVVSGLACSASPGDAAQFAKGLDALADSAEASRAVGVQANDRTVETRALFALCAESSGCADGCSEELEACAEPENTSCSNMLAGCFPKYKAACDAAGKCEESAQWIRWHVKSFAADARGKLTPADARELDAALARLAL